MKKNIPRARDTDVSRVPVVIVITAIVIVEPVVVVLLLLPLSLWGGGGVVNIQISSRFVVNEVM